MDSFPWGRCRIGTRAAELQVAARSASCLLGEQASDETQACLRVVASDDALTLARLYFGGATLQKFVNANSGCVPLPYDLADSQKVPSEFKISEKWDVCLERTVINFGMGVVAAGLAGVVLTRECYMCCLCMS